MGRDRFKNRHRAFVMIWKDMLRSPAWLALSNAARVAYIHLAADYNGRPEKQTCLRLAYSQAQKLMAKKTYTKAIRELLAKGFIKMTKRGGLFKNCSQYALSEDWKSWKPTE